MKNPCCYIFMSFLALPWIALSQDKVGIGTINPNEKLEVSGIIYTNAGGVRFPDETLQTTAAFNNADPEDDASAKLQPYLLITAAETPLLPDTMFLLDVRQGGFAISSIADANIFLVIKELDKSTPILYRKGATLKVLPVARIEFPRLNVQDHIYETIEMRSVIIQSIEYKGVYRQDGTYAHVEIIQFLFQRLEIKYLVGNVVCYCWDFFTDTACACD